MIVHVSPDEKNVTETISSLKFAQRVRAVELGQASKTKKNKRCTGIYVISVEDMYISKYLLIQTILCI